MIALTATRVTRHTSRRLNERIERHIRARAEYYTNHPGEIERRLRELDDEWDIERSVETGSSILSLLGITLALARGPRWLALPLAVQSFFLQHAVQGWCPPIPLFRRLGVRTQNEIEEERYVLKTIRGDFDTVADSRRGRAILEAIERT
jgi:hypothetical protein